MSVINDAPSSTVAGADGDVVSTPSSPPKSKRAGVIIAVVLAAVVVFGSLIAWAVWAAVSQSAIAGVSVGYDSEPVTCTGTTVEHTTLAITGDEYRRPVIILDEDMTCELRIQVVNDGWTDVDIDSLTLTSLWEDNVTGLVPIMVNPNGPARTDDEAGARFDMGTFGVPAGTTQTLTAVLEYNGDASMMQCAGQGWNIPLVTVSAMGAARGIQPPERDAIWVHKGTSEECGTAEE
jgi:hypothetical protein